MYLRTVIALLLSTFAVYAAAEETLSPSRIFLASRPSVSADGKQFVFEWNDTIWIASTEGGVAHALQTGVDAEDSWPVLSPDATRVAFLSTRDGGRKIFEITLADNKVRQITYHSEATTPYAWTPDGEYMLCVLTRDHSASQDTERIGLVPMHDRGAEKILFDVEAYEPSLDKDGKRLLFTRHGEDLYRKNVKSSLAAQVWFYNLSTKEFTPVIRRDTEARTPLWRPDGMSFYYVSGNDGCMNIWCYDLKTDTEKQITFFKDDSVIHPSLSADGHTMIFRQGFDFWKIDPTDAVVKPERIILTPAAYTPRPANRRRYYNSCWNNDTAGDIDFCDNGMQIAFTSGGDLWAMDTLVREPKCIHGDSLTHERECAFTPDGNILYFLSDRGDGVDLWAVQRNDPNLPWWENSAFSKTRLTHDDLPRQQLRISPDGTMLSWTDALGKIFIATTNGTVIATGPDSDGCGQYAWSPDSRWIAAALNDNYSNSDIWVFSVTGEHAPYNISRHFKWDGSPCWSPDGKIIAFSGVRPDNEQQNIFYVWLNREDEEYENYGVKLEKSREIIRRNAVSPVTTPATNTTDVANVNATNTPQRVVIDFENLHLRVHRIQQNGAANPFFSHDNRTLGYANLEKRATYTVKIPDRMTPELLSKNIGAVRAWLPTENRLLWMVDNLPAHNDNLFKFSVYQETNVKDYQELVFRTAWGRIRDLYYDKHYHGVNWNAIRTKYLPYARNAPCMSVFRRLSRMMLGELNSSHLGFYATNASIREWEHKSTFQAWRSVTAHLGLRFDSSHYGRGWRVRDVVPHGPADQVSIDIAPGDLILELDGVVINSDMDPAEILNGPADRKILVTVQRGDATPRTVLIQSTSYSTIRENLRTAIGKTLREKVHAASNGRLGYLNIDAMNWEAYYQFEQEIFSEGFDKDGMIIDVRNNHGGFVADYILSILCGSVHSLSVRRGGNMGYLSGYWGRPVWYKPIVVLCNAETSSNGEIFAHAIKALKRGKVVGVPTGGNVIATSDRPLLDFGNFRDASYGWFLLDGRDMEHHGAIPDVLIQDDPQTLAEGRDVQLEAAIAVLANEVKRAAETNTPPKLQYAH